jgi:hypothetical protein
MRYFLTAWVFAAQLLVSAPALAASLSFSMDFELFGCPLSSCGFPQGEILDGPFADVGHFNIDSELLSDSSQTLISFSELQDFSLSFPGVAPFFSFDQANLGQGSCFTDPGPGRSGEPSSPCGMLFTGTRFDGFAGEFLIPDDMFGSIVAFGAGNMGNLEFIAFGEPGPGGGLPGALFSTDGVSSAQIHVTHVASAPVPEPSSMLLLLAGAGLVGRYARRQRRAPAHR